MLKNLLPVSIMLAAAVSIAAGKKKNTFAPDIPMRNDTVASNQSHAFPQLMHFLCGPPKEVPHTGQYFQLKEWVAWCFAHNGWDPITVALHTAQYL